MCPLALAKEEEEEGGTVPSPPALHTSLSGTSALWSREHQALSETTKLGFFGAFLVAGR